MRSLLSHRCQPTGHAELVSNRAVSACYPFCRPRKALFRKRGNTSIDLRCSIIPFEIMALTIGTQLGSYEITALLGKGGMGEVYRARDLKLKREVAIKVLPADFSRDADRVSRFQREAELLASLSHPNIAGIYDLQQYSDSRFLVLELVEGE